MNGSQRRLDWASLILLIVGVFCGVESYWLITDYRANPLILVPAVVAATIGATHLIKREARR